MAKLPHVIKDFTGFVDGVGFAGRIQEGKLPKIALVTEEHTAGGMGGSVDIGMGLLEKLEAELTMDGMSADFTKMLGQPDGGLTLRGSISDGYTTEAAVFQMRGLFKEVEFGNMKRKDKGTTKLAVTLTYFKANIAGVDVTEVDVLNKVWRVHGTDRFAEQTAALGG